MHVAQRMKNLGTETAFLVLARAKALEARGKHIIHLEIGEPDFDTPVNIKNAAKKALQDGYTHYRPAQALSSCRRHVV
jgi:aspartate/methionine/tyrosine aminotransferase